MTDIKGVVPSALAGHFDAKAALPRDELHKATRFVDDLAAAAARGEAIAHDHIKAIGVMLDNVEERLEAAGWNLAVMVGQESLSVSDIDTRLAEHAKGIDHISNAVSHLRATVQKL